MVFVSRLDLQFITEFLPNLKDVPITVLDSLTGKLQQQFKEHQLIGVITCHSQGEEPDIYTRKIQHFQAIRTLADGISTSEITTMVKRLSTTGYHGTETIAHGSTGIGLVKISDDQVLLAITALPDSSLNSTSLTQCLQEHYHSTLQTTMKTLPVPKISRKNADVSLAIPKPRSS